MRRNTFTLVMAAAIALSSCAGGGSTASADKELDAIVSQMTLEEKLRTIIGTSMDNAQQTREAIVGNDSRIIKGAAGTTFPMEQLGIPSIVLADGPAGLRISPTREGETRTYYCTYFPIGTLLASTWNQELIEQVGTAMGEEVREYGVDVYLAPALNIQRNPLCGRNFEYYSEDPVISGKTAAAYVKGVQSNDVGTSIKHFAGNSQETNRKLNNAIVSDRALREIYLKGFEIAVKESQPWTVMTSYNAINGCQASENEALIEGILRNEWGFEGTVMSDWNSGDFSYNQVIAGNDMIMPGNMQQYNDLKEAIENGTVTMDIVDRNVKRILSLVKRTPRGKGEGYSENPDLKAHAQVTRQSSLEGMVLLKNDAGSLPIDKQVNKVALFGYTSYNFIAGGTGSGSVNGEYVVSLLDGLKNAGYTVDQRLEKEYQAVAPQAEFGLLARRVRPDEFVPSQKVLDSMAEENDIAILTLGRISGESNDRLLKDFSLSDKEMELLQKTADTFHAKGKKLIVILNIGGVIETASWKDIPDAILLSWQAGQEGGNSVADLLTGKKSPSGRLAVSFPVSFFDLGSSSNFPIDPGIVNDTGTMRTRRGMTERNIDYTIYEEGIYVGYRWLQKHGIAASYPFGYGLSYTSFSWDNAEVKLGKNSLTASVTVTNTGSMASKEVVELYISAPAKDMDKPVRELKAYGKTKELQPGESQTITLDLDYYSLASFDESSMKWVTESGDYTAEFSSDCDTPKCSVPFKLSKPMSWAAPTTLSAK